MQNKVYTSNAFNNFVSFIQVSQLKLYAFQHKRIGFISVCYTLTASTDKVAHLPVWPRGEARQKRRDRGEAEAITTRRDKTEARHHNVEARPRQHVCCLEAASRRGFCLETHITVYQHILLHQMCVN
jgi:hypothetical protein